MFDAGDQRKATISNAFPSMFPPSLARMHATHLRVLWSDSEGLAEWMPLLKVLRNIIFECISLPAHHSAHLSLALPCPSPQHTSDPQHCPISSHPPRPTFQLEPTLRSGQLPRSASWAMRQGWNSRRSLGPYDLMRRENTRSTATWRFCFSICSQIMQR